MTVPITVIQSHHATIIAKRSYPVTEAGLAKAVNMIRSNRTDGRAVWIENPCYPGNQSKRLDEVERLAYFGDVAGIKEYYLSLGK